MVNLNQFRWHALTAEPTAIAQKGYTANCNSNQCSLAYGSSVTVADTLVYALGWYGQSPPSTPTDTVGSTFALGASNSLTYTYTPALVQHKYLANCNAATCGLAYTSNVVSGNTLVYGLGWFNQSPPSTPTDTRGDAFSLGASQSVVVTPPTPALVQHRYTSNCNSAVCGLAFSSPVTQANTLVYGLGWSASTQYYVPVTITNNVGSGIAVDNSADNECDGANSCSVSLTTSGTNEVIFFSITDSAGGLSVTSVTDGAGLTWHARQSQVSSGNEDVFTYYAIAVNALSSDSITANLSGNANPNIRLMVLGVSGANTASPFDPNLGTAPTNSATSNTATITFSTTNANDLIIGTTKSSNQIINSGAGGYTALICCNSNYAALEYKVVSATGSNTPSFNLAGSNEWGEIGDAIQALPSTATPATFQQKVTWNPSAYSTYEAADLGNVRFCADIACATPLNAWLESCTPSCMPSATSASAWVKLTSTIAGAGGQATIYMAFTATTVEFDGNYWGEAPQLSGTYGQYDNGPNVFTFYDNFAGSSLSNKWTAITSGTGTVTVNNHVTLATTGPGGHYAFIVSATQSQPQVAEAYMVSQAGGVGPMLGVATGTSVNTYNALYSGYTLQWSSGPGAKDDIAYQKSTGGQTSPLRPRTPSRRGVWGVTWAAAGTEYFTDGTIANAQADNNAGAIANYGIYIGQDTGGASSFVDDYARMRAYPPADTMPSVSLGSGTTGNVAPAAPTDTLGDTYTLGTFNTVTTGIVTYFSYVWFAAAASSGADTVTATFSSAVAGSISIYEIQGYSTSGTQSSTGGSSAGTSTSSVGSFTPASNSFVVGNTETGSGSSTFTASGSYALVGSCSGVYGCSEYQVGLGSATTASMTLGGSTPWVETAMSFPPAAAVTYYSYVWYATAASSGADTISATFGGTVTGSVSIY